MLLTVDQAAEKLQLAPYTVREHLKSGLLRGIKRGRQWRVPESALGETIAPSAPPNPLAEALALVQERDAKIGSVAPRVVGETDAASELRAIRSAQTP